jgi:hypothetical protein
MDLTKVMPFCLADPVFFEPPERLPDDADRFPAARRPAPAGWLRNQHGLWVGWRPAGALLPAQGWKIHVSATLPDAERVLGLVWEYCVAHRVAFKVLRSRAAVLLTNAKDSNRAGSGKLATVYPADESSLAEVLTGLAEPLAGVVGPYILSDLRYGPGPLYLRYGAFVEMHCPDAAGEPTPALYAPDGRLVQDRRGPVLSIPDWAQVPKVLHPSLAARQSGDAGDLPYDIERALHFSNGGGVYLATDRATGGRVVLREARPHAGLDRSGADAVARLERERAALTALAGLDCVPRLLGHHVVWEHHFLVEEYVEGQTLFEAVLSRYPLVHPDPAASELDEYQAWAMAVVAKVEGALEAIHRRGIRFGDLHPANIILRPDGQVVLVDFELAGSVSDTARPALGAAGFVAPKGLSGADVDAYALECLRLYVLLPLTQLLDRDPSKVTTLAAAAAEYFPTAPRLGSRLQRYLRPAGGSGTGADCDAAAALFAGGQPSWPAIRDSLVAGIHASATPDRDDRLFPGDITQIVSHGLALGSGAAGVLLALHRVGAPVPEEYVSWLVRTARGVRRSVRRGLYDGLHGVAAVLDTLGRADEALEILDLARADGGQVHTAGLFGGRAGIGLNLLHFARRTGDSTLADDAVRLGDDLAALLAGEDAPADLRPPAKAGLLRGMSGPALFFLHLHGHTGDSRYLDLAETALRRDLDRCVTLPSGTLQVQDGSTHLVYLDGGSGGIALVLHEYLRHREDAELAAAVAAARLACRPRYVFQPGLLQGRAGIIAALCHLAEAADRPIVRDHTRRLGWHALRYGGHLAFPGRLLLRLSMDLATGSAGILLALHAAFEDEAAAILPYLDTRLPAAATTTTP